jgi:hypothetical protein
MRVPDRSDPAASVGLVVNPNASRDVRRLTTLARSVGTHERTNTVARVLHGLSAAGIARVAYMPDPEDLVERAAALDGVFDPAGTQPELAPVLGQPARDAAGTARAAAALLAAGVRCIVTLGGDGTNRAVAAGWPDAVLLPLPGGTNNAFALAVDPTAAGLAAGLYARAPGEHARHVRRRPLLEARLDGGTTAVALVDVSLVGEGFVGAHAIVDPDVLLEAVVARSDPALPGICGIAGALHPLAENGSRRALCVRFGPGRTVLAPLGPGRLVPLGVSDCTLVGPGDAVELGAGRGDRPATLALDGEREHVLAQEQTAVVRLVDGPSVLDAASLLRDAAAAGELVLGGSKEPCP